MDLRSNPILKLVLVLAACSSVAGVRDPHVWAQGPGEYEVKAAFLYNFAKFVDWPSDSAQGPFLICTVGRDSFSGALDAAVQGKTVGNRELTVRHLNRVEDARSCQIVFISGSERKHLRAALEALNGASVLTVGETEGFARMGGVINFVLEDNKVHFEINIDAATRARLSVSSKLLGLARIVRDTGHGGK